jgi:exoribonuclease R
MQGIREGRLFEGKYMADRSYCKIGGKMVKLDLRNNRALFGDVVAIELDPRQEWKERVSKPKTLEEEAAEAAEDTLGQTHTLSERHEDKGLIQFLESNSNIQPSGTVVSVIKRQRKAFCGSINFDCPVFKSKEGMQNENEPEYEIYEFLPAD